MSDKSNADIIKIGWDTSEVVRGAEIVIQRLGAIEKSIASVVRNLPSHLDKTNRALDLMADRAGRLARNMRELNAAIREAPTVSKNATAITGDVPVSKSGLPFKFGKGESGELNRVWGELSKAVKTQLQGMVGAGLTKTGFAEILRQLAGQNKSGGVSVSRDQQVALRGATNLLDALMKSQGLTEREAKLQLRGVARSEPGDVKAKFAEFLDAERKRMPRFMPGSPNEALYRAGGIQSLSAPKVYVPPGGIGTPADMMKRLEDQTARMKASVAEAHAKARATMVTPAPVADPLKAAADALFPKKPSAAAPAQEAAKAQSAQATRKAALAEEKLRLASERLALQREKMAQQAAQAAARTAAAEAKAQAQAARMAAQAQAAQARAQQQAATAAAQQARAQAQAAAAQAKAQYWQTKQSNQAQPNAQSSGGGGNIGTFLKGFLSQGDKDKDVLESITSSLQRHVFWIAQSVVIWGALRSSMQFLQDVVAQVLELEKAMIRVGQASGKGLEDARGSILFQGTRAAGQGIDPDSAADSLVFQAQAGMSEQDMENARRAFVVFGGDYRNILQEIIQTNNKMTASGVSNVRVMDYLASAMRRVPSNAKDAAGALEIYMDALQSAIPLAPKLGVGVEQLAIGLGKIAFNTEAGSASSAGTYVENFITQIQKKATQEKLKLTFGIDEDTVEERAKAVLKLMAKFTASGDQDARTRLLQTVYGGSLVGANTINQAQAILAELNKALNDTSDLDDFTSVYQESMTTLDMATRRLSSSWEAFLTTVAASGPVIASINAMTTAVNGLADGLGVAANWLQAIGNLWNGFNTDPFAAAKNFGGKEYGQAGRQEDLSQFSSSSLGPGAGGEIFKRTLGFDPLEEMADYMAWVARGGASARPTNLGAAAGGGGGGAQYGQGDSGVLAEDMLVKRLINLQKDQTDADFQRAYASELVKLQAVPNYEGDVEDELVGIMDPFGRWIKNQTVSGEAASLALKKLGEEAQKAADAMSKYGGIQELPEGVTFEQFEAMVRDREAMLRRELPQEYQEEVLKPKEFFYQDGDRLRKLVASSEGTRLAAQELVKLEKQKISGIFNVPDEGRVMVPFYALQQGFVPSDRLPGEQGPGGGMEPIDFILDPVEQEFIDAARAVDLLGSAAAIAATYINSMDGKMERSTVHEPGRMMGRSQKQGWRYEESAGREGEVGGGKHSRPTNVQVNAETNVYLDGQRIQANISNRTYRSMVAARNASGRGGTDSSRTYPMR